MHPDAPETRRLLAGFDQAAQRGMLTSDIVSGLAQKHELPQERILATLEVLRRVDTSVVHGECICWPAADATANDNGINPSGLEPTPPARSPAVTRHAEASLLQAAIDYAVHHGLMDTAKLRSVPPAQLFRAVIPIVADHATGSDTEGNQAAA